jgi:PPM family protein phosphatase
MSMGLRYTVRSDVGLLRDGNEDSAYAGPYLQAIADGMGGHAAGEVASAVAIATIAELDKETADPRAALAAAVERAHAALEEIAQSEPATEGMGTTLTALLWSGDDVTLCHIGDSRAYLLRDGELRQISHDHTLVQSLVDEGKLTPEAASAHPQRSLVMRALQSSAPAEPDLETLKAKVGDRFLLCSDGLSDVVSDETIGRTLVESADPDAAVDQLVDLAIRSGGPDNITCVLADVIDTESGQPPTEEVIRAGAVTDTADEDPIRADSPATRAHLLTRGFATPDDEAADQADAGDAEAGEDQNRNGAALTLARIRRWPVVTTVLIVLFAVVGAAGYIGWQLTQNQYYVGTAGGRVVVYRGVDEAVAGFSLSSVVQRTNIPLAAVPAGEAGLIKATIPAGTFTQAQSIVRRIGRDYRCAVVHAQILTWLVNRPPAARSSPSRQPVHVAGSGHARGQRVKPNTATARHTASRTSASGKPHYPPKPILPSYCPAYSWSGR